MSLVPPPALAVPFIDLDGCKAVNDEFIALCEDTSIDDAEVLEDRILTALRSPVRSGRSAYAPVTASIGITSANLSFDVSDLLHQADAAMYRAKAQGRDQISH